VYYPQCECTRILCGAAMSVLGAERSSGGGRAASDGERPRSAPPPIASAIGLKRVGEAQASPHLCPLLPCPPAGHLLICAYLCFVVLCCALLCFVVLCCAYLCFVSCRAPPHSRDDLDLAMISDAGCSSCRNAISMHLVAISMHLVVLSQLDVTQPLIVNCIATATKVVGRRHCYVRGW